MNKRLKQLLSHLSVAINPARERAITDCHYSVLCYEPVDHLPLITMYPFPPDSLWQPYPHRETFDDPEKMLFNELVSAWDTSIVHHADVDDDLSITVRANFGTILIASMFEATVVQQDDNTPWVVHQPEHQISLQQVAETDPMDFSNGWIIRASERMQAYHDIFSQYPELMEAIRIVLPDLQGPFDNLELICGSELFLQLATEPEAVNAALHNLATAQVGLFHHFSQWTTERDVGYCHQHGFPLAGNILLRNDSCIMISSEMYRNQIACHDERVLRECGGGGIHSCGDISHLVDEFLEIPSLRSLDLGQSEMNDVDAIYVKAAKRKVPLIRVAISEDELVDGKIKSHFPTGAELIYRAKSVDDAKRVCQNIQLRK
jgi:hypothetical protein